MKFKKTQTGDIIKINNVEYVVKKVYPNHIRTENIQTEQTECFTFGDLVMAGIESGMPDR